MDRFDHSFPPFRDWLRQVGRRRTYGRGTVLFHQGARTDHVVLIEEGLARVTTTSPGGYVSVLAMRGQGELVGEFAALDGRSRSATCTAVEPLIAMVVTGRQFLAGLSTHPQFALLLLRRTVHRIREADRWRSEFGAYTAGDRVVLMLDRLARQHGRPVPDEPGAIVVATSQREIAGAVGASRDSVIRALRSLESDGILYTRRERIVITNPRALGARADRRLL